jgi:tetratricopeptide (TPR) repeat protein
MVEILEYIESYFENNLSTEDRKTFENRVVSDNDFAQEVATYITMRQQIRNELLHQKQTAWRSESVGEEEQKPQPVVVKLNPSARRKWLAIAASLFIVFSIALTLVFKGSSGAQHLAQNFANEPLSSMMDGSNDSLQLGIAAYKNGDYTAAEKLFIGYYATHPDVTDALAYSGRVSLQLKEYDKAVNRFKLLANQPLHANPGLFYEAVSLLLRNKKGDKEEAKRLLEEVVAKDLDKLSEAKQLLDEY